MTSFDMQDDTQIKMISEALGKSVVNKRSLEDNPFKEQLELDSKELMVKLLERNKQHKLTEF